MKKIIGIMAIVIMSAAVFFTNSNNYKQNVNVDLSSLIGVPTANAESDGGGLLWKSQDENCNWTVSISLGGGPLPGSYERTDTYYGTRTVCKDGWSFCWSTSCS